MFYLLETTAAEVLCCYNLLHKKFLGCRPKEHTHVSGLMLHFPLYTPEELRTKRLW